MIEARKQIIMVVEDSDDDYEATERGLLRDGRLVNQLIRFETGEAALDHLLCAADDGCADTNLVPGVILLDLNLPGKGGAEFLANIKKIPKLCRIPVVVLTTSGDPRDIQRCYDLGANTYIQKPVDLDRFFAAVGQLRDYWIDLAILPEGR